MENSANEYMEKEFPKTLDLVEEILNIGKIYEEIEKYPNSIGCYSCSWGIVDNVNEGNLDQNSPECIREIMSLGLLLEKIGDNDFVSKNDLHNLETITRKIYAYLEPVWTPRGLPKF